MPCLQCRRCRRLLKFHYIRCAAPSIRWMTRLVCALTLPASLHFNEVSIPSSLQRINMPFSWALMAFWNLSTQMANRCAHHEESP